VRTLPIVDALVVAGLLALYLGASVLRLTPPVTLLLLLVVWLSQYFLTSSGVYDSHRVEGPGQIVRRVIYAHLLSAAVIIPGALILGSTEVLRALALVLISSAFLLSLFKALVHATLQVLRRSGFDCRNVLYLGLHSRAREFAEETARHPEWGLRVDCVGTGTPENRLYHTYPDGDFIGDHVEQILKNRVVDEVLISVGVNSLPDAMREARLFEHYGVMVRLAFEPVHGVAVKPKLEEFGGEPALAVTPRSLGDKDLALKRAFDAVLGSLSLLFLSPLMIAIAVLVKLTSSGPVFFVQTRVGLNGRRFRMLKFRTMVDNAEFMVRQADRSITNGPIFKDPRDYRITPIGRLLRKFSLDELPQLVNVVRGEMSLVGPRPLPVYEAEQIAGEYRRRFTVPPGLTCIWQISGRSDVTYDNWMKYDLQYVDRSSIWFDTLLLIRTIPVVLSGRGGY
jgi:exopolysaccharide biosynthesis polyprenyl glycosylphosphotransferase